MPMPAPEPARPRRQPPDVRREQLLDAAEQVLLSRGLGSATVADVAQAAGLAKGTVYLYFRSKNEILAALRARYLDRFAGAVDESEASVERFIAALYDFSTLHRDLHHLLFHEAGFSEDDAFVAVHQALEELIVAGVEAGTFDVSDARLTAGFILHGLHGMLVASLHDPAADRAAFIASATGLARRVLGAKPSTMKSPPKQRRPRGRSSAG